MNVMAGGAMGGDLHDLRGQAKHAWAAGNSREAHTLAWQAFDRDPASRSVKWLLTDLLRFLPSDMPAERRADYLALLRDRDVEPDLIETAGWLLWLSTAKPDAPESELAAAVETDALALALLHEAPVGCVSAERLLTRVRRWLLLADRWSAYPRLAAALTAQAALNGGAWPFDAAERAGLAAADATDAVAAYLPLRPPAPAPVPFVDPVTRAVAEQYEGWPYPAWTRIPRPTARSLPETIAAIDPGGPGSLPVKARILVAGCGSGREAAGVAATFPDASVIGIDLSAASIALARQRCAALGIGGVRFEQLDLYEVARLSERFDAIFCNGVLHHLPDPERGLRVLSDALQPAGCMHIMLYSTRGRLRIAALRLLARDLIVEPVDDDLLRRLRARLLERADGATVAYVLGARDFATLAGTYDLLLHRHEDPFNLPRLQRALEAASLSVLSFQFRTPPVAARYDALFPADPQHRNLDLLNSFEQIDTGEPIGQYRFWCRRNAGS